MPEALAAVGRGGTVALAGIHMTDVPAHTRADGEELLRLAPRLGVRVQVAEYGFDAVDRALADLAEDRLSGSAVVTLPPA